MKIQAVLTAAFVLFVAPAFAATSDITSHRRADFAAAGTHQFYAWCANGQDRILRQQGASARDAEARLNATGCRLSWQGRIKA